ncbi:hypothetical protein A2125_02090 [Candidatus Woesebacteria bacterium GWB1_43_5]|uniref:Uncharacterized protein n=1 Tax=Candidatus Woesebacteria bacterium GWB1_43_5 TaxID=1802474 RepID=A0A1F7WRG3_9BACT|nr:MAG: hypothetical protein A2125_02090 [Candidatus Woesebacteria bacterium GWB1_43_5]
MSTAENQVYNYASESLESKRIPDPYPYLLNKDGKLILAYTGEVVQDHIERQTYLGQVEFNGLIKLQNWFIENDSGKMIWISPPYPGEYEVPKIIVSEIIEENKVKILFNRAIVVDDLLPTDCFLYARDLNGNFIDSLESLRANPIALNENIDWLEELSQYIDVSMVREFIESGRDKVEKEKAIRKARLFVAEAKKPGVNNLRGAKIIHPDFEDFYGDKSFRCKPRNITAFQTLFKNSQQIGGKEILKCVECPFCHKIVDAEIYDGEIHCPADKGCGKSAPYQKAD